MRGVVQMALRGHGVVGCLLVVTRFVMPGRFAVMPRRVLVMLGCFCMMLCCFSGHNSSPVCRGGGKDFSTARMGRCDEIVNS